MAPERVNYYTGQRLDADDFRAEQRYQDRIRRLLNHGLFTPGVVEGLEVSRIPDGATPAPRTVRVSPGTALDAVGRLIVLDDPADVPVPNQPPLSGTNYYYLVLRYAEEPVPGRADDCSPPGTAPVARIREEQLLDWSEVIPFPRDTDPEDSIEQGVVIALVQLKKDCTIEAIDPAARRLSFPRNVSRVQAVAFEGEKDIAPGKENTKKLYFHIRGGPPSSVVLYLRGDKFSPTAYTESAEHRHTLSGIDVGPASVSTKDHKHDIDPHGHQLVHGNSQDPGMAPDGLHIHPLLVRSRVDKDFPQEAVSTSDYGGFSKGYYERGWRGDILHNVTEYDRTYLLPPSTKKPGSVGDERNDWEDAPHTHEAVVEAGGPTSTKLMTPSPVDELHSHTFAATVDPAGSTGPSLRGGTAYTYLTEVKVALDGNDITPQLIRALPVTWTVLGGIDENEPFNKEGTGPLDLVQMGLALGPGEHWLEFSAAGLPPVGGKIIYNLYIT
jgi:hypothetical protein